MVAAFLSLTSKNHYLTINQVELKGKIEAKNIVEPVAVNFDDTPDFEG